MEFTIRDLIYISVYVASVSGFAVQSKFNIKRLIQSVDALKAIIFLEKGGLNIVNNAKCKEHRELIDEKIKRETVDALNQIQFLNANILKIMSHMNIEPEVKSDK